MRVRTIVLHSGECTLLPQGLKERGTLLLVGIQSAILGFILNYPSAVSFKYKRGPVSEFGCLNQAYKVKRCEHSQLISLSLAFSFERKIFVMDAYGVITLIYRILWEAITQNCSRELATHGNGPFCYKTSPLAKYLPACDPGNTSGMLFRWCTQMILPSWNFTAESTHFSIGIISFIFLALLINRKRDISW